MISLNVLVFLIAWSSTPASVFHMGKVKTKLSCLFSMQEVVAAPSLNPSTPLSEVKLSFFANISCVPYCLRDYFSAMWGITITNCIPKFCSFYADDVSNFSCWTFQWAGSSTTVEWRKVSEHGCQEKPVGVHGSEPDCSVDVPAVGWTHSR